MLLNQGSPENSNLSDDFLFTKSYNNSMISFNEAFEKVMSFQADFGVEVVDIKNAEGRVLAEGIATDRDYPPFNRATKDGIALNFHAVENGRKRFEIKEVIAAGTAVSKLQDLETCVEIMTGAVVPYDADTVVMYEHLEIEHGIAKLNRLPEKGQNIHFKGSDEKRGSAVLPAGTKITAAEVGVLATVGKAEVSVRKLPRVSVISTGNELVDVHEEPLQHQIRRSNSYSLYAALAEEGIVPLLLHLNDDPDIIRQKLQIAIQEMEVILLSGGVSKGKFDHIPAVLEQLGVNKVFHGVSQKPGKPFWFGIHPVTGTRIFSFPGNPVSTFVNFHVYFKNWLRRSLGLSIPEIKVFLNEQIRIEGDLTRFLRVKTSWEGGRLMASLVTGNGSGDLISLASSDGFILLEPREKSYKPLEAVTFLPSRRIV